MKFSIRYHIVALSVNNIRRLAVVRGNFLNEEYILYHHEISKVRCPYIYYNVLETVADIIFVISVICFQIYFEFRKLE